ncbi:MAG: hypothetical protein WC595_03805 [Candidatus Nanoarchaeia archaeon]
MKIIPFEKQPLETRIVDLDASTIDSRAYVGQDSVVYRDNSTNRAIHVYHNSLDVEGIVKYAKCVNALKSMLEAAPFEEEIVFEERRYVANVCVNPVEEVGEKWFRKGGELAKRKYTASPFVSGPSLCWPHLANGETMIARCFDILFYQRVNGFIESKGVIGNVDIHPVNVKFKIEREKQTISLIVTDLAKSIGDVYLK